MLTSMTNAIVSIALILNLIWGGIFASLPAQIVPTVPVATEAPAQTPVPTAAPVPPTLPSGEYVSLERGASGEDVLRLQQRLSELGYYTGSQSGKMDSATQLAYKKFEKANGYTANGVASPEEQALLFSDLALAAQ